ncbi:hypothetical protein F5Y08DRAFT_334454 [Xylaria arbuscula]|nr:hypothetical protein F5Y08DRAFT_334454 [Xylaria arbuscula]
MDQVVDAIISSAKGFEPELELLSRTDGLKKLHEDQTREFAQVCYDLIQSYINLKVANKTDKKLKKARFGHRYAIRRWLHRATTNAAKLETEETNKKKIDEYISESSKAAKEEFAALLEKKCHMRSLLKDQSYKLEERARAQEKINAAYKSWFTSQVPPTVEVHIVQLAVNELRKNVKTLKRQVALGEITDEILSEAQLKMESCVSKIEEARDYQRGSWIEGYSYKYTQRVCKKILLAAKIDLESGHELVAQAHELNSNVGSLPPFEESFHIDHLTISCLKNLHHTVDQQLSTVNQLCKSAKSRTKDLKAMLSQETICLAEAKHNLEKEQREAISILANKEYLQPPPLYVPQSSGTATDTSPSST